MDTLITLSSISYAGPMSGFTLNVVGSLIVTSGISATYGTAPILQNDGDVYLGGTSTIGSLRGGVFGAVYAYSTATLNIMGSSGTFGGYLLDHPSGGAALAITVGDGTHALSQTLTGSGLNTYSGTTTVAANATLVSGAANALSGSSAHVVDGTLTLASGSSSVGALSGSGSVNLNANTLTIAGAGPAAEGGSFDGVISGSGGSLVKSGTGTLILSGENMYSGGTVLQEGALRLEGYSALGTGTLAINGGTIGTVGTDDMILIENNVVANADFAISARGELGAVEVFGNVELGAAPTRTITLTDTGLACFGGVISGQNLTLVTSSGSSQAMFCSDTSNTFSGTLRVGTGVLLQLEKDDDNIAVAGDAVIDAGGTIETTRLGSQFAPTSNVEVNGTLRGLYSGTNVINVLTGTGRIEAGSYGGDIQVLAVNSGTFAGTLTEEEDTPQSLIKQSPGTLRLTGSNSYTGETKVNGGKLVIDGDNSAATGDVTVAGTATLGGSGTIGGAVFILDGGTLSPGNSPGQLTLLDDLTLSGSSTLLVEFSGSGSGMYDQLDVQGTFTAGGALSLMLIDGFTPLYGASFTIFNGTTPGYDLGSFDILTNLGGGLSWDTSDLASAGIVTVVPEPSTYALVGFALLVFGFAVVRERENG